MIFDGENRAKKCKRFIFIEKWMIFSYFIDHFVWKLILLYKILTYYADGWEYVELFSGADNFSLLELVSFRILLSIQLTHNQNGENRCWTSRAFRPKLNQLQRMLLHNVGQLSLSRIRNITTVEEEAIHFFLFKYQSMFVSL